MFIKARELLREELKKIEEAGLYKRERVIQSAQGAHITVGGRTVMNFCANNYLGLANNEQLRRAAKLGIDDFGLGLASVRFICGTQSIHKELEATIAEFHRTEDAILYAACFDANGGLFETLMDERDAIVSDSLNHASIIDGVRLSKAKRYRYEHNSMEDLERTLKEARKENPRKIIIATDGVFSMDGDVADLRTICELAERFEAMVMVDECHATGFFGPTGRGAAEHCGVLERIDVITSTLGKALGGAVGGFTTGRREIIEFLRQRSRPYLFSNSLPPAIVVAGKTCFAMLSESSDLRDRLRESTAYWRSQLREIGFTVKGEIHPICPVMLGDASLATRMADDLLGEGIYVIGFSYPVVPHGQARIRTQISAAHSREDLDRALEAFSKIGRKHGVIS